MAMVFSLAGCNVLSIMVASRHTTAVLVVTMTVVTPQREAVHPSEKLPRKNSPISMPYQSLNHHVAHLVVHWVVQRTQAHPPKVSSIAHDP